LKDKDGGIRIEYGKEVLVPDWIKVEQTLPPNGS